MTDPDSLPVPAPGGSPDDEALGTSTPDHARPNRILRVEGLVKRYKRPVVDHVSLEVRSGEVVGLLGQNGAGKTTTFYMVVGLVKPDEGRVFLDDEDITRLPMHLRARRGLGYLAQQASIFQRMTVEENITAILELQPGLSRSERRRRTEHLLEEMHIKDRRHQPAPTLSGGERRRAEIARALATNPDFFLLDEPFAGVDPLHVSEIRQIVRGLVANRGLGVLLTDHNPEATLRLCDRVYLLADGKIFLEGTSEEIATHPEALERYLGKDFNWPGGSRP